MCIRDRGVGFESRWAQHSKGKVINVPLYHVAEGPGFESPRAQNPKGGSCAFLSCHVAESAKKACELAKFDDNQQAVGMLYSMRDSSERRASSGKMVGNCDHGLSQEIVEWKTSG